MRKTEDGRRAGALHIVYRLPSPGRRLAGGYNSLQGDWMHRQELTPKLKDLIVRRLKLDVDPTTIDDGAPLFGDGLGLDSIDALELVLGLEQEFGIKVEDEEVGVKAFASVNALADFVEQKKSA
jgi:acyl carrier protein